MKIAIVDDNPSEINRLSQSISLWAQQNGIVTETKPFDSGEAFSRSLSEDKYDIVFMDIILNGQNGIETARQLRHLTLETLLIFVTSSTEFMAQAFPCHAFDYVIKPCQDEQIHRILNEAMRALHKPVDYLDLNDDRLGGKLLLSDILYVYSDSNYCDIYTKKQLRKVRISFTELSQKLSGHPSFMVVGRGVIVNFDNTSHISGLDCVMTNGDKVPVSRRKIKETEQAFLNRQFSQLLAEGN